jgi:hypothetical protein
MSRSRIALLIGVFTALTASAVGNVSCHAGTVQSDLSAWFDTTPKDRADVATFFASPAAAAWPEVAPHAQALLPWCPPGQHALLLATLAALPDRAELTRAAISLLEGGPAVAELPEYLQTLADIPASRRDEAVALTRTVQADNPTARVDLLPTVARLGEMPDVASMRRLVHGGLRRLTQTLCDDTPPDQRVDLLMVGLYSAAPEGRADLAEATATLLDLPPGGCRSASDVLAALQGVSWTIAHGNTGTVLQAVRQLTAVCHPQRLEDAAHRAEDLASVVERLSVLSSEDTLEATRWMTEACASGDALSYNGMTQWLDDHRAPQRRLALTPPLAEGK